MKLGIFGINNNVISIIVIAGPVFFFLVMSNTDAQTMKKSTITFEDGSVVEVEQTCLKCNIFSGYESIVEKFETEIVGKIGDMIDQRSDLQFLL